MKPRLTRAEARRIGLAAQGLCRRRPARVTLRHVQGEIDRLAQFQIDSVNVAVRAHLMPLFARLGPYDAGLLTRAAEQAPRRLFEYWGHAACLIDVGLEPALRVRKRALAERGDSRVAEILTRQPDLPARIVSELETRGPLSPREIEHEEVRVSDHWGWNWSEVKHVLEFLFATGEVSVADRNAAFERRYDLTHRVLPNEIVATPDPSTAEAQDLLVSRAAAALGVADLTALSEYFYLRKDVTTAAIARLVTAGQLEEVEVTDVPGAHWLWHEARKPRTMAAHALVSPFDSSVFERQRLEHLYGTRYRIEIYVPQARREYGYYVYLFWLGDTVAARVDLKAERAVGVLRVQSAWLEEGHDGPLVAVALASALQDMAQWLGLRDVAVVRQGSLADALASVV